MILKSAIIVAILIALVLVYAATKPGTLYIQRKIVINAPADRVFALINDLHRWPDWNADDAQDSTVTRTFSGPATGVDSILEWDSRGKAGKGKMLITDSEPPRHVAVKVDFVKPFVSHNLNEFTLDAVGASTKLTWSWHGQNLYFMKVMGIFMNMDKMIGKHFDDGLVNLKRGGEIDRSE